MAVFFIVFASNDQWTAEGRGGTRADREGAEGAFSGWPNPGGFLTRRPSAADCRRWAYGRPRLRSSQVRTGSVSRRGAEARRMAENELGTVVVEAADTMEAGITRGPAMFGLSGLGFRVPHSEFRV